MYAKSKDFCSPEGRMSNKQFCIEQCDGDCITTQLFIMLNMERGNQFNSKSCRDVTSQVFTYSGNEYFKRSFSPSSVVIRSIICPEAVWNSTCKLITAVNNQERKEETRFS